MIRAWCAALNYLGGFGVGFLIIVALPMTALALANRASWFRPNRIERFFDETRRSDDGWFRLDCRRFEN